jgi:TonB family protein
MRTANAMLTLVALGVAFCWASAANATRDWRLPAKPASEQQTPQEVAQDYVHIMDRRGPDELVSVQWLAPQAMVTTPEWRTLLDKYIVIGVSHVVLPANGETKHEANDAPPVATDEGGAVLRRFSEQNMPPEIAKLIAYKIGLIRNATPPEEVVPKDMHERQIMRSFMSEFQFFAFQNTNVHDCASGRLTVRYAGENYTFDTPILGCIKPHTCADFVPAGTKHDAGTTTVAFTITAIGKVVEPKVASSSGYPELDAAAVQCAQTWRYNPAIENGKPVAAPWKAEVKW